MIALVALLALGPASYQSLGPDDWRGYRKPDLPKGWQFESGVLSYIPGRGPGGDIVTKEQYADFDLVLEWKISLGGNSGIMFRVSEDQRYAWQTGPEYQLLDNARAPDGRSPLTSAGSIYALVPPVRDATKPAEMWNEARIVLHKGILRHSVNGVEVATADLDSQGWKDLVAKSKFRGMAGFAKQPKGHIVLQDHGNSVWFRNLRIRRL